jgi:hypothetical protein
MRSSQRRSRKSQVVLTAEGESIVRPIWFLNIFVYKSIDQKAILRIKMGLSGMLLETAKERRAMHHPINN